MSFVAVAVVGAGALAAGATVYSSNQASKSQDKANAANAKNVADTNALNYEQFLQSRGSDGSAVLPTYLKLPGGETLFEEQLGKDLVADYMAGRKNQAAEQAAYKAELDRLQPARDGATRAVTGVFDGTTGKQLLDNQTPVSLARMKQANAVKDAGMESLAQTINQINAIQRGRGFSGDSLGGNLVKFNATRGINTDAAMAVTGAGLQNAQDEKAIRDYEVQLRLQNLNLPNAIAQSNINALQLPEAAMYDQQARRMQPLNFLRIGTGQFQYQPLPTVQPTASTGQLVGQGLGQFAGGVGNYFAQQQLANTLKASQPNVPVNGYQGSWTNTPASNSFWNPQLSLVA